ncbi:hypothetical protein NVP1170O_081 [Vibrio phage 1.170.O._10N.261.52.C3]|nr:hypothetical protein NVP1170O_081 [Vibrio phage 1.170.O._10N.261.52.C3]
MWTEISFEEYMDLKGNREDELVDKDCTDWLDFVAIETYLGSDKFLRRTEQDNYDEVEEYPATIRYWKWGMPMKVIKPLGQVGSSSYWQFLFEKHNPSDVCLGDQLWSDGEVVEVYENISEEDLDELLNLVKNKKAFKGMLRRVEII